MRSKKHKTDGVNKHMCVKYILIIEVTNRENQLNMINHLIICTITQFNVVSCVHKRNNESQCAELLYQWGTKHVIPVTLLMMTPFIGIILLIPVFSLRLLFFFRRASVHKCIDLISPNRP